MAFQLVQTFNFEDVQHSYDRAGDVLYISFGSPRPAVAVQVEDWLAIRLSNTPPLFAGVTIVLTGVALAASYIPALRAMSLDPITTLHSE